MVAQFAVALFWCNKLPELLWMIVYLKFCILYKIRQLTIIASSKDKGQLGEFKTVMQTFDAV